MSIGIQGIKQGPTGGYHADKKVDRQTFSDSLRGEPAGFQDAMTELRRDTIEIILRTARTRGQQVVKVVKGDDPVWPTVRPGFATFLRFLQGSGIPELEETLGFAKGTLSHGAYLYSVDHLSLNASNIFPEGYTDWSDGVTARERYVLSQKHGVPVTDHPSYPASTKPIIQFRILDEVPYVGQPRFVKPGEIV
jgi:hypothetical protein